MKHHHLNGKLTELSPKWLLVRSHRERFRSQFILLLSLGLLTVEPQALQRCIAATICVLRDNSNSDEKFFEKNRSLFGIHEGFCSLRYNIHSVPCYSLWPIVIGFISGGGGQGGAFAPPWIQFAPPLGFLVDLIT